MTIEESYESIGDDLDMDELMQDLQKLSLDELRAIRRALGHDVEASEREFLAMLKSRGLLKDDTTAPTADTQAGEK